MHAEHVARRFLAVSMLALVSALPATAGAQTRQFGSSLSQAPNANFGCETKPTFTEQSTNGDYFPRASGTADCTWYQVGVFGNPNAQPVGAVPGDGTVTNIAVRSGPTPAALRFVVLRLFADADSGSRQCCFFVTETNVVQPAANQISNFTVNLPVERNTNPKNNLVTQDYIGISGVTGTGTLPLFSNGNNNTLSGMSPGNPIAAFYYPRFGALASDTPNGPGRREEQIPGFVVTIRSTWTRDRLAQFPGSSNLAVRNGAVPIDIRCLLSEACRGAVLLRTRGGGSGARASKGRVVGRRSIVIAPGKRRKVRVKLNRAGRRLMRDRQRARLVAVVRLGSAGETSRKVTVRRPN